MSGNQNTCQSVEQKPQSQINEDVAKELEKVKKEMKDFVYIISHDLKAPLRGIKTLAGWIVSDYADKLDDEGKEQLTLLSSRVDHLHNLIEGVLQYSRIGRITEEKTMVDVKEAVDEAIRVVSPSDQISVDIGTELPRVYAERKRMVEIFQHLISNAVKFNDKAKGQIDINCVEDSDNFKFSVADIGPGIAEEHYETVFMIFRSVTETKDENALGIGLTLTKKIVETYGGEIWIESKPCEGTTFFFTLPKHIKYMKEFNHES